MASCCGGTQGDPALRLTRGATYRLSGLWTHRVNGTVVPLDAADWTARLVMKRSYGHVEDLLELTSDPDTGITLSDGGDSIRFHVVIDADVTALLPVGSGYVYTLAFENITDPDDVRVVLNDTARVKNTAL
jgi:hypothetical protein